MRKDPVDRHTYDDEWIASAWSESGNEALLAQSDLKPRPRIARAMELLRLTPGLRLLDIACGRGEVPALASRAGVDATGIDYSDASISFAAKVRGAMRNARNSDFNLVQGDACSLPFANESFDRVSMLDIVEHLIPAQLESMFKETARILSPGGYAVVHTLPNRWVYEIGYRLTRLFWRRLPTDPRNPYEKRIHVNEQDIIKLHRMLVATGLSHRLWLEQHIPAQARWLTAQTIYHDQRDDVYPLMSRWPGRLLEALSTTPLRLILCNDIFAVLWRGPTPPRSVGPLPRAWIERTICGMVGAT